MNVERINQLADDLDKVQAVNASQFNMSNWGYAMFEGISAFDSMESPTISTDDLIRQCGSAGCLAGWTALLYGQPLNANNPQVFASQYLELNEVVTDELFTPKEHNEDEDDDANFGSLIYGDITAGRAAKVLRHLAATGDVDWN